MSAAAAQHPELTYAPTLHAALNHADVLPHLTDWPDTDTSVRPLSSRPSATHTSSTAAPLDLDAWQAAGWTYRAIGRQGSNELDSEPIPT